MRRELMLLSCLFAACRPAGYPDIRFERMPADPRFGVEFAQSSPLRSGSFASAWNADGLYVAILEDPGMDTSLVEQPSQMRAYRVDPATGHSTKLPDPPFPPFHSEWAWGRPWVPAFQGPGMILAEETEEWRRIMIFESGWRQLEYPVGVRSADSIAARPGGQIVLVGGRRVLTYDGLQWGDLPIPDTATQVVLGPWDDAGVRVLMVVSGGISATLYDVATRTLKNEATLAGAGSLGFPRFQNGTTSDFRFDAFVGAEHRAIHFSNGFFTIGPELPGVLVLDSPGAPVLAGVATAARFIDHDFFGPFLKVDATETLVVTGTQPQRCATTCPCDREVDPKCACLPRSDGLDDLMQESRVSPDGSAIGVLFTSTGDGVRRYAVRRLELPFQTSPLDEPFTAP